MVTIAKMGFVTENDNATMSASYLDF
jgi:hypothetical protein